MPEVVDTSGSKDNLDDDANINALAESIVHLKNSTGETIHLDWQNGMEWWEKKPPAIIPNGEEATYEAHANHRHTTNGAYADAGYHIGNDRTKEIWVKVAILFDGVNHFRFNHPSGYFSRKSDTGRYKNECWVEILKLAE